MEATSTLVPAGAATATTMPIRRPPSPLSGSCTRAATGYAAALLDVARCTGALDAVEADARRVLRGGAGGREQVHRLVAVLVGMLERTGRVGMVAEVMGEVGRLCNELRGTKVVVVASEGKLPEEELAGIAEKVCRRSGAASVKVRHVVRSVA